MSDLNINDDRLEGEFNKLASLLVRLDVSDGQAFLAAAEEFRGLSLTAGGFSGALLAETAGKLEAAAGTGADREELLDEAGKLLEEAMDIYENALFSNQAPVPPQPEQVRPLPQAQPPAQPQVPQPVNPPAAPAPQQYQQPPQLPDSPQPAPQAEWPAALPAGIDMELLGVVITEATENLQLAEGAMLSLETNPSDQEGINSVFRAFHTIKGISGYLGLTKISELAHHSESLLSKVREGRLVFGGAYADMSLRSVDTLKELLQGVRDALGGQPMAKPSGYDALMADLAEPEAAAARAEAERLPEPAPRLGDILVAEGKASREDVELAESTKGPEPLGVALVRSEAVSLTDVGQALRKQQEVKTAQESSVRVRTDRLDRLIDMIGELVIAQSMLAQDRTTVSGQNLELARKVNHSGKIVRELQDLGMSMRMVPLKATFQKMTRIARDLAKKSGKEMDVSVSGEDTEVDRNIVSVVDELLMHMVRNSVDHGLESPAERAASGKPPKGSLRLSASHAGDNIVFRIEDDGRGLNKARIKAKALERGLIRSADGLSDSDVHNLIFMPGFSTAEKITDISGRGVGMDVVKQGVEKLRGRIDTLSEEGKGCVFTLKLPLTMAITDGMVVRVGGQRFIIPTGGIHILLRPEAGDLTLVAGRGELLNLRGEMVPIFRLHGILGTERTVDRPEDGLLVVVDDGGRRAALLVDEVLGQQQVVAKSIKTGLEKTPGVSGGAILGDGKVGLILDSQELADMGRKSRH